MNPQDFYGKPLWEGKVVGESFNLPLNGEFAAFVALKD